ncbi:MAG: FtsX-like permease family protein [Candidatus Poseidoniia archaeon]
MNKIKSLLQSLRAGPDSMRLATLSAWRGKERGLAVFAGVFLATLVMTTVFSYGVGLSQIFFQETLKNDPYDAKLDLYSEPGENVSGWTNDSVLFTSICDDLTARSEIADCSIIYGRQGIRTDGFFDEEFGRAQPLNIDAISSTSGDWTNVSLAYPAALENGPPINGDRIVRIAGDGLFDGEFAERHAQQILYGEWPSPEDAVEKRAIVVPSQLANMAGAEINDTIDSMTITYVTESIRLPGEIEECAGTIHATAMEYLYCRESLTIYNMTVVGIYEEWDFGNPTLLFNPVFISDVVLDDSQKILLMDNDHAYLGLAVDRSQLPTASTAEAEDWLDDLKYSIESQNYTSAGLELSYTDIVSGSITFLNIFLGLIQTFDYIIMIPIVILSISVLIYGLILSLEQRRREVSINRVMGATAEGLQRMVLLEILVISSVAWIAGYFAAMWMTPLVLDSVGFMSFRSSDFEVDPALGAATVVTVAMMTIGLAILFARSRTKRFLAMEIEEGVRKVAEVKEPRRWLHWLMLAIGLLAMVESRLEDETGGDGLLENFFIDSVVLLTGPFLLWIGGALVLARLGASGPKLMKAILGKTPLLKDVKRGLSTSGSSESIDRLAIIMLLTLSIVTLAAVQGFTGTLVDEKTASVETGSDLQVQFNSAVSESEARDALKLAFDSAGIDYSQNPSLATSVPILITTEVGQSTTYLTWVLLDGHDDVLQWDPQAIPGDDVGQFSTAISTDWFTAGGDVAEQLDIPGERAQRRRDGSGEWLGDSDDIYSITLQFDEISVSFGNDTEPEEPSLEEIFSVLQSDENWSGMDFSDADLSGRDLGMYDFTAADLSGANLRGANLSGALLVQTDLRGADLTGANLSNVAIHAQNPNGNLLQGANFTSANLTGAWGFYSLGASVTTNSTCPNGITENGSGCVSIDDLPPEIRFLLASDIDFEISKVSRNTTIQFAGKHSFVPGLSPSDANQAIVIGESTWRILTGANDSDEINQTKWFFELGDLADEQDGDLLRRIRVEIEADSRVSSAVDWSTKHRDVERNGGMIFGTPGLLSLQFVVASLASIASAFVFLSLVLSQRRKDLAILQAIGASPNQVIRLTLFEILSIVLVSMVLGVILGVGISQAFNGFFSIFGFIFQIFGGASTPIERDLVWPWFELFLVNGAVMLVVILALFFTTKRALNADLATVLKGE